MLIKSISLYFPSKDCFLSRAHSFLQKQNPPLSSVLAEATALHTGYQQTTQVFSLASAGPQTQINKKRSPTASTIWWQVPNNTLYFQTALLLL